MWIGENVSIFYWKVYGRKTFAHVPYEWRSKLHGWTIPFIFVDYGDLEFSYKIWDLGMKKIIISRDVVFYENEAFARF